MILVGTMYDLYALYVYLYILGVLCASMNAWGLREVSSGPLAAFRVGDP